MYYTFAAYIYTASTYSKKIETGRSCVHMQPTVAAASEPIGIDSKKMDGHHLAVTLNNMQDMREPERSERGTMVLYCLMSFVCSSVWDRSRKWVAEMAAFRVCGIRRWG